MSRRKPLYIKQYDQIISHTSDWLALNNTGYPLIMN